MFNGLSGNRNTAIGANAMYFNESGSFNTAAGHYTLRNNTTGNYNAAYGVFAMQNDFDGSYNVAIGPEAMRLGEGSNNVAIGHSALYGNADRSFLVAVGDSALYHNGDGATDPGQGTACTAVGSKALYANSIGKRNTATGYLALTANTQGNNNTALGASALLSNTLGFGNTSVGLSALQNNTDGDNNSAFGLLALQNSSTGDGNTAIGAGALFSCISGGSNTAVGFNADITPGTISNAMALGNGAVSNSSNKVRIGNSSVTVIEGQVAWTFPSDARFKYNINDATVPGLEFIERLRPVTYQFDTKKYDAHITQNMSPAARATRTVNHGQNDANPRLQTGFLAQDVEQTCIELGYDFSGLHVPENAADNYGLAYGSFVPLLVKAVQELSEENDMLRSSIENHQAQIDELRAMVDELLGSR
jgi:hypothetical protein